MGKIVIVTGGTSGIGLPAKPGLYRLYCQPSPV